MRKGKRTVQGGGVVGAVFGVLLGAATAAGSWIVDPWGSLILAAVFGCLGYFLGDRFWDWLSRWAGWL